MALLGLLYVRTSSGGAGGDTLIPDLGFIVPTGAAWTLLSESSPGDADGNSGQYTARDIRNSADLTSLINLGTLEWSKDASVVEPANAYVADYMMFQDFTDDFGCFDRLGLPTGPTVPVDASGIEGEIFWESDTEELWLHDGTMWVMIASPSGIITDHGTLTGLPDDDHLQYLLLGGSASRNTVSGKIEFEPDVGELGLPNSTDVPGTFTSANEGDIAWDSDDDCLYLHNGTDWVQAFCLTSSGIEFPGGSNIDHGELDGLGDDDHPQYGHLLQNEIVSGVWTFDSSGDTDPAFIIDPDPTAPTTNLVDGAVSIIDDIMSTYDATRGKWLSVDRIQLSASKKGGAKNVYLRLNDQIATSETGYRAIRDATITAIAGQTDAVETWTLRIRKNDSVTNIASLVITAASGDQDTTINVDLDQGDEIQLFADVSSGNIHSPVALIELAWRN